MQKERKFLLTLVCVAGLLNFTSCIKNDAGTGPAAVNKCDGQPGPLFTAVKTMMAQRCVSCHNNNFANGGMNWTVDCNIITHQTRIKVRAVDQGSMPPGFTLPQADKDKITAWINAGGAITN